MDTVTSSNYLQIEFGFNDGDSRKQNIPSPKSDIAESDVAALNTWISSKNIVIGDKYGASTTGINSATIIEQTKTKLDLE